MTDLSLFDFKYLPPAARATDPQTSALAAEGIKPANDDLCRAIRKYVLDYGPSTSWEIAQGVAGDRWQFDSVRTACARAGLVKLERFGISPGGRSCCLYALRAEPVEVAGEVL